jgi:hypothetical protein
MANIRIKDLSTTASTTASDDFFGVDGATNGTRKLNAYSPTFGGNLTVSGTGTVGGSTASIITPQLTSQSYYQSGVLLTNTKTDNAGVRNWALVTSQDSYGDFQIKQSNTLGGSATAGTAWLKISETGATTLAGNLTVSGTSTLTGNVGVGSSPNSWQTLYGIKAIDISNGAFYGATNDVNVVYNAYFNSSDQWIYKATNYASKYTIVQGVHTWSVAASGTAGNSFSFTEAARITTGGNLLVGTTTDSANGKLQLATHTTSAGGIGFGTDVSLYRKTAALVALNGSGGAKIDFHEGGTLKGGVGSYAGSVYLASDTTSPILCYTNGSLALTLDSSQNATFAGTVIANKATTAFRIPTAETPASASATGTVGTITWDSSYIYVCTAANTWKRVAIATWP